MGAIVCKSDKHGETLRGYIAMLVVDKAFRKHSIGALSPGSPPAPCSLAQARSW